MHRFNGKNGMVPQAGLLRDSIGNLYGTTIEGGDLSCSDGNSLGCGTVYKLDNTGHETLLYKFKGSPDGYFPESLLAADGAGNLYGTTYLGGSYGFGSVIKLDSEGNETVLYSFTGGSDGCLPYEGVILDSSGSLYGVATEGGAGFCNHGDGVAYKLDPAGNFNVLYTFGGSDGAGPDSVLLFDSAGNLYGTTGNGGSSKTCPYGCGTVFKLTPTGQESVLYNFCSLENCADGQYPGVGPLVRDSNGTMYGTTNLGGAYRNCNRDGCGVVFKLDSAGTETVLHNFTGGADGAFPRTGVIMDASGVLYGTTWQGGDANCRFNEESGCGVMFTIKP
jgi:uncharacterized repeat protein (TIGR03803 family)